MNLKALKNPFDPSKVHWRIGAKTKDNSKGMALAYLDARDVMERLDEVCGPENWQDEYTTEHIRTLCRIGIKIGDSWIWKSDGAGDTDVEAEKGAISDAFKRAAVKWGIGRYLYDVDSPWVPIVPAGKSYKIGVGQEKVLTRALLIVPGGSERAVSGEKPPPPTQDTPEPDQPSQSIVEEVRAALEEAHKNGLLEETWKANNVPWQKRATPAEFGEIEVIKNELKAKEAGA